MWGRESGAKQFLAGVSAAQIEDVKLRRAQTVQRSTADKDLGVLKAFFNWCIDRGLAAGNPVRRVKFLHSNNERIRYLLDEEWDRLRTAAAALEGRSPSLVDKMVLARNTGLRRAVLFRAHWAWVDWLNRVIRCSENEEQPGTRRSAQRHGIRDPQASLRRARP